MITIEHAGGVGIHAKFIIRQDGKHVGSLDRFSPREHWRVRSYYYGHVLANVGKSLDFAKQQAMRLTYPSKREVYELLAAGVAQRRQRYAEIKHAHELARLGRALVAGSNSARAELEQLLAEIDAWVADRSDTRANRLEQNEQHYRATGERVYTSSDEPLYPEPPEDKVEAAA